MEYKIAVKVIAIRYGCEYPSSGYFKILQMACPTIKEGNCKIAVPIVYLLAFALCTTVINDFVESLSWYLMPKFSKNVN
jgi:hypothetical protein